MSNTKIVPTLAAITGNTQQLLGAIARKNAALPPRWSLAVAACHIATKMVTPENLRQCCALTALDEACLGPQSHAIKAVAARVALAPVTDGETGCLMMVAFPILSCAICAVTGYGSVNAGCVTLFRQALEAGEISADTGEAWASMAGNPLARTPAVVYAELSFPEEARDNPFTYVVECCLEAGRQNARRDAFMALLERLAPDVFAARRWVDDAWQASQSQAADGTSEYRANALPALPTGEVGRILREKAAEVGDTHAVAAWINRRSLNELWVTRTSADVRG